MKKATVVLLCVGCLLAGRYSRELDVHAGVVCAEVNGDVNGDGVKDITDPIVLLGHLFLGTPEELPWPCALFREARCAAELAEIAAGRAFIVQQLADCEGFDPGACERAAAALLEFCLGPR